MAECFLQLPEDMNPQMKDVERIPSWASKKIFTSRHKVVKLQNTKDKANLTKEKRRPTKKEQLD